MCFQAAFFIHQNNTQKKGSSIGCLKYLKSEMLRSMTSKQCAGLLSERRRQGKPSDQKKYCKGNQLI